MLLPARLYNPEGVGRSHALPLKHASPSTDHRSYAPRRENNPCVPRCQSQDRDNRIHSRLPPTHRTKLPGKRIHCDLFGGGDSLLGVGNIHYGALVVDDATCIKIPITLKTKDTICGEIISIINRVETHTGRQVKYFRSDDG